MSFILEALRRAQQERGTGRRQDLGALLHERPPPPRRRLGPWVWVTGALLLNAAVLILALVLWSRLPSRPLGGGGAPAQTVVSEQAPRASAPREELPGRSSPRPPLPSRQARSESARPTVARIPEPTRSVGAAPSDTRVDPSSGEGAGRSTVENSEQERVSADSATLQTAPAPSKRLAAGAPKAGTQLKDPPVPVIDPNPPAPKPGEPGDSRSPEAAPESAAALEKAPTSGRSQTSLAEKGSSGDGSPGVREAASAPEPSGSEAAKPAAPPRKQVASAGPTATPSQMERAAPARETGRPTSPASPQEAPSGKSPKRPEPMSAQSPAKQAPAPTGKPQTGSTPAAGRKPTEVVAKAEPPSKPSQKPTKPVALLRDLPLAERGKLDKLRIDAHVYTDDPAKRLVFINMRSYRAGDRIGTEGLVLESVTPDGVIIDYGRGLVRLQIER